MYTVTFSKEGFKPTEVKSVELVVGQPRTIDAQLEVGPVTDAVEVTASLETLNRTSAEVGGLVEAAQIKEIPVDGRNWASLMLLVPGAINYGDAGQRAIQFNGHSLDDSNFVFDGIDTSGVQEQTQKADARLNISLDSIAEFRVSTAVYTAEAGAAGGAQVSVVSKSGSNDYHGSTFYDLRNDHLDARSPFDPSTLPSFTLNQFGASFGGAIVKDKAFFYANYEGLRQSLGETFVNFVPNAAFRSQVLATSPVLAPIINAYPKGTVPIDSVTDQIHQRGHRHGPGRFRHAPLRLPVQRHEHCLRPLQRRQRLYRQPPATPWATTNVIPLAPLISFCNFSTSFLPPRWMKRNSESTGPTTMTGAMALRPYR